MADAFWMQLGANPTFALEVGGQIVGITYWVQVEAIGDAAGDQSSAPESGWYFVAVTRPTGPERVAQGLELKAEMSEEEVAETVQDALEMVANEVLAGEEDE